LLERYVTTVPNGLLLCPAALRHPHLGAHSGHRPKRGRPSLHFLIRPHWTPDRPDAGATEWPSTDSSSPCHEELRELVGGDAARLDLGFRSDVADDSRDGGPQPLADRHGETGPVERSIDELPQFDIRHQHLLRPSAARP
jgi:hypothetical protein